ncbi:hypothetical protein C2G38_2047907 [Gigaspora rosea]|uniref:Acylamino-acid-releasing enzyme N-terminal domain-containing protein n=1 Tax=Gigaspora rosea TaxID=44941 RepID=A0A397U469_9GLOM|nr:hypothetical protein C2G38_2047907 [Gigaspora rosea]
MISIVIHATEISQTWRLGSLINVLDVTDVHGEFYADDEFGGLYWSKAVYVAEQNELKDSDERKFDYTPSCGERFNNKHVPLIVVFDISKNEAKVLPKFEKIDPGQVYLSKPIGGPHYWCSELYEAFITIDGAEFVLMHSNWRSQEVLLAINLSTCKVQQLTTTGSWNLLSVWDKYILATQGSTFEFHKLQLGIVTGCHEDNLADQPDVEKVHRPKEVPSDKKSPLIVVPHGGPHDVYVSITQEVSDLARIPLINLLGNIGNLEIEEV